MRRPLPPFDHIARALLVHGARDAAVDFLEAAVVRGGAEAQRCQPLLQSVRARPTDRVSGPPVALDAALVEDLAAFGRLVEAWAVTRGASVGHTVAGVEVAAALAQVMEPLHVPEPWHTQWMEIVATGSLPGIQSLEQDVLAGKPVPPALLEKMRVAARLLRGFWTAPAAEPAAAPMDPALVADLRARLAARDLAGAQSLLRAHVESPGVAGVAMAMARLVAAAERMLAEDAPSGPGGRTLPLEGGGLGLFHFRMGNVEEAERIFRALAEQRPNDPVVSDRLGDVSAVVRALNTPAATPVASPAAPATVKSAAPGWLDKNKNKPSVSGWAAPEKSVRGVPASWEEEDSTSVIRPDEEAELHVKAGHPERAVPIYQLLVMKYPDKPRFKARLTELETMLAARAAEQVDIRDTEPPEPAGAPPPAIVAPAPAVPQGYAPAFGDYEIAGPTTVERWRGPSPAPPKAPIATPIVTSERPELSQTVEVRISRIVPIR